MTDRKYTDAVQPESVFTQTVSGSQTVLGSPHTVGQKHFALFGVQIAGTTLPNVAVLAEELRRLHLLCESQARRLDDLEAREHLSWPTRSAYAHLEIDP
ncbi:hypothetical protein [Deinococcus sp. QL22]|uniref:hypothetical protein n=1 Tax=Deinococcus sp. QL22 TaxID=2939437 RepID=UPI00201804BA|nr:hypothetical protein [Deinococcus sp. QL22]UQN09875.1 hypothetical protein M1R55_27270 [Deinococcus sp. QL22]